MKKRDLISWARWLFLPTALVLLVVIVTCTLGGVNCFWIEHVHSIRHGDFWLICLGGAICGAAWVILSYCIAPRSKLETVLVLTPLGVWLAWFLISGSYYRRGFEDRSPIPMPTLVTWCVTLVGLLTVLVLDKRRAVSSRPQKQVSKMHAVCILGSAVVLLCVCVLPSAYALYKMTVYRAIADPMQAHEEDVAAFRYHLFAQTPFLDLDWAPSMSFALIPFGQELDAAMFGCASCRGMYESLMQVAARNGPSNVLAQMIKRRGSLEYNGDRGRCMLDYAIFARNGETLDVILDCGADPGTTNLLGAPMHEAVRFLVLTKIIERLISAGADINQVDWQGRTPLDYALMWNRSAVGFLSSLGATNGPRAAVVQPIAGHTGIYNFVASDFCMALPAGFSAYKGDSPSLMSYSWTLENTNGSRFYLETDYWPVKSGSCSTNFNGMPASVERTEQESKDGSCPYELTVYFASSDASYASLQPLGQRPYYDTFIQCQARSKEDMKALEDALRTFRKMSRHEFR